MVLGMIIIVARKHIKAGTPEHLFDFQLTLGKHAC